MTWGGKRPGAGRPRVFVGRKTHSIYCTAEELIKVRKFLRSLRYKEQTTKIYEKN